ncbi:hypothetical protein AURDEDRAFT_174030 [Auricularia subglabra TFB-10046 SS5]|uniref:F-box domain-containing protein n=1 Tax=Auricularia subglabra (strain TFB-10046 / SS5) TaxID=717982 RepID=J0CZA8_AURST|nr:hypothetical protein AURDEDRAFT_174030 [Auricularia subglabra TFB-10046 SS5]
MTTAPRSSIKVTSTVCPWFRTPLPARQIQTTPLDMSRLTANDAISKLPVELLRHIMQYLDFRDRVSLSHANARLRNVAVTNPALWENIRLPIRRESIDAVHELVGRTLPDRHLRAATVDITPDDLQPLSSFVTHHLGRLETLELYFAPFDLQQRTYLDDLDALWRAFGNQAADRLISLTLFAGPQPIHTIPASIFNRVPPSRLRALNIEGFRFESVCPAFATVMRVSIDLAGLPTGLTAPSLGELFPGALLIDVERCESHLVPGANGELIPHDHLSKLPVLTAAHPVPQLHMAWNSRRPGTPDDAAAQWTVASSQFVGYLSVLCPDHAEVRAAALYRAGAHANALGVLPVVGAGAGAGATSVSVSLRHAGGGVSGAQTVVPPAGTPLLAQVVASVAPYAPGVTTLVLSTARLGALLGVASERYGRLSHLVLYLERENMGEDGRLIDPSNLQHMPHIASFTHVELHATSAVTVDSTALLALLCLIAPNCTEHFMVSPFGITVTNPQLLLDAFPRALPGRTK